MASPELMDHKSHSNTTAVLLSILGGVVGLALATSALAPSQVTTAILLTLAAAPWLILFPKWTSWPGWKYVFASMISIAALTTGVWRLYHPEPPAPSDSGQIVSSPSPTTSPTPSSGAKGGFEIVNPKSGGDSPACVEVRGTGKLPDGKTLVLSIAISGTNYYALSRVDYAGTGSWNAKINLGDRGDKRMVGRTFTLEALVMDSDLVHYLLAIAKTGGPGWWASTTLPPHSEKVASATTTRNGLDGCG